MNDMLSLKPSKLLPSTGMLTVHEIYVEESLDGVDVFCPETILRMTESMVCNSTYPLTQVSLEVDFELSFTAPERLA